MSVTAHKINKVFRSAQALVSGITAHRINNAFLVSQEIGLIDCDSYDIKADFETGDETEFDSETDADNDLNASANSKYDGSYGMEVTFDDATVAYGTLNLVAVDQTEAIVLFAFNPNTVIPAPNTGNGIIKIFNMNDGGVNMCEISYEFTNGTHRFYSYAKTDAGGSYSARVYDAEDAWVEFIFHWKQSSGADDGFVKIYRDGVYDAILSQTGIDNDTIVVDDANFGMLTTNIAAGFSGDGLYFDQIKVGFFKASSSRSAHRTKRNNFITVVEEI